MPITDVHPLAYRMRPENLDEVVGQQHLVGPGMIIRKMVESDTLMSMILYGPPGIGKTSIANAIAGSTHRKFDRFNAATGDKAELRKIIQASYSEPTVLLLDEIHRLDKTKQDYLLPSLESGNITLVGATTENPYISVTPAIKSRVSIFELKPLNNKDLKQAVRRALGDKRRGLGSYNVNLSEDVLGFLVGAVDGDVRSALNGLELAVKSTKPDDDGVRIITKESLEQVLQRKSLTFDKSGDNHYDTISALQKSVRGSDLDAAMYYTAILLNAGDLSIVMRRLRTCAYEDIGVADPVSVEQAIRALETADELGMPEARIPVANAVVLLCLAPKSNSAYQAINKAMDIVQNNNAVEMPDYIREHPRHKYDKGHMGYVYPHNYDGDWVRQRYLPKQLSGVHFFNPKGNSNKEQQLKSTYDWINKNKQY